MERCRVNLHVGKRECADAGSFDDSEAVKQTRDSKRLLYPWEKGRYFGGSGKKEKRRKKSKGQKFGGDIETIAMGIGIDRLQSKYLGIST